MNDIQKQITQEINLLGAMFFGTGFDKELSAQMRSKQIIKIFRHAHEQPLSETPNTPTDEENKALLTNEGRFALAILLNTWKRRQQLIAQDDDDAENLKNRSAVRMGRYLNQAHADKIFQGLEKVAKDQQSTEAAIQAILTMEDIEQRLNAFADSLEWAFSDYQPTKQKLIYRGTQAFAFINVLSETLAVFALGYTALAVASFSLPLAIVLPFLAIFLYYNAKSNWIVFKSYTPEVALDLIGRERFHKGVTLSLEDRQVKKMDKKSKLISALSLIFTFTSAGILAATAYFGIADELGNNLPDFLQFLGPGLGPIAIIASIAIFIGIGLLFYKDWARVAQKRGAFFKEAWRKVFNPKHDEIHQQLKAIDPNKLNDPNELKKGDFSAEDLLAFGYSKDYLQTLGYKDEDLRHASHKKALKTGVLLILTLLVLVGMAISAYMGTLSLESIGVPALPAILLSGGLNMIASAMFVFNGTMSATAKISNNLYETFSSPIKLGKALGSTFLSLLKFSAFLAIAYFTFTGLGAIDIPTLANIGIAIGAGVVGYQIIDWTSKKLFSPAKPESEKSSEEKSTDQNELEQQKGQQESAGLKPKPSPKTRQPLERDKPFVTVKALTLEEAILNAGSNAVKNIVPAIAIGGPIFSGFLLLGRGGHSFASMYGAGDNTLYYGHFEDAEITRTSQLSFENEAAEAGVEGDSAGDTRTPAQNAKLLNTYGLFKSPNLPLETSQDDETLQPPAQGPKQQGDNQE